MLSIPFAHSLTHPKPNPPTSPPPARYCKVLIPQHNTMLHSGITLLSYYNSGHISNPFSPPFIPNAWTSLPPFIQCGQELIFKTF